MYKPKIINVNQTHEKWMKLVLHLYNAPPAVHHCIFQDADTGIRAASAMRNIVNSHPTWFPITIIQRGCDVWVIKNESIQKAVIHDD